MKCSFVGYRLLGWLFFSFPSPFLVCYPSDFWPPWFLMSKLLLIRLSTFLCEVMWELLSSCYQDVSMYICHSVYLTWNLLSFWDTEISVFIVFQRFSAIISLHIFCCPFLHLFFWNVHYAYVNTPEEVSGFWDSFQFSSLFFLSAVQTGLSQLLSFQVA